jgi:Fur family ferric uptake transcriptional regulator
VRQKARSESHSHVSQRDSHLQKALAVLEKASLRQTQPRVALLKTLISEHGPFSVDELRLLPGVKSLDRVTIYRCLTAFEELGLVRRCEFGDGASRYEYSPGSHHHHHVVCKKCRKMENLDQCVPESMLKIVRSMGYEQISHSLEFFGICRSCQKLSA